jgi:hypothetical protein
MYVRARGRAKESGSQYSRPMSIFTARTIIDSTIAAILTQTVKQRCAQLKCRAVE